MAYFCLTASLPFSATANDPSVYVHWLAAEVKDESARAMNPAAVESFIVGGLLVSRESRVRDAAMLRTHNVL